MGAHLINGEFQSDKYPTTPRGKVPLSVKDKDAQPLLYIYANRHEHIDREFSDDLRTALKNAGYDPMPLHRERTQLERLDELLAEIDRFALADVAKEMAAVLGEAQNPPESGGFADGSVSPARWSNCAHLVSALTSVVQMRKSMK